RIAPPHDFPQLACKSFRRACRTKCRMGPSRGRIGRERQCLQGQTRSQNPRRRKRRSLPRDARLPSRRNLGRPARFFDRGRTRRHRQKVRLGTRAAVGRNHQQHQQADHRRRLASGKCAGGYSPAPSLGRGRFFRRRTRTRQERSPKSPRLCRSRAGHGRGKLTMASAAAGKMMTVKTPPKAATGGRFGAYGGRYVPETLMAALEELEREYEKAKRDRKFQQRLDLLLKTYAGRPTPLFFARRLSAKLGGAKTCSTPARTKLITASARPCWSSAWASTVSSRRPGPASTALPRPPSARCSASSAWCTWARRTCAAKSSTSSVCVCSALTCAASIPVRARSRTPSTKPCATGSPTCAPRITCLAACSERILIRLWCATSIASSDAKLAPRSAKLKVGFPQPSSPASVEDR